MNYFYLDGVEKKGPFDFEELKSINLPADTLVFGDGMKNWTPYHAVPELNIIEKAEKLSPPSDKIYIPSILFLIIGLAVAVGLSYLYTSREKDSDLNDIEAQINSVLQGKDEVCDFYYSSVFGKLQKPNFLNTDNAGKPLVEIFKCEAGGWQVLTLTRRSNGFDLVESYSTDMGFKVPDATYVAGRDYGYGIKSDGYSIPTYRGTVQAAYKSALDFLTKNQENQSYMPGSYAKIREFEKIQSEFYSMENVYPSKISASSLNAKSWGTAKTFVFNSNWIVWYEYDGKHFEIVENRSAFLKSWITYSLILSLVTIIIFYSIKFRKKITFK